MTFLVNMFVSLSALWCIGLNDPGKNPGEFQNYVLNQLKPDCYYNWSIYSETNLNNPKFNPMLFRINDGNINYATTLAKKYPSRTWLLYNEPEGSDQANTKPEDAAIWFDKAYKAIKDADSTATIACCGVMVRDIGIEWLEKFVKSAKNKPDVWHIHIYINSQKMSDWLAFWDWFLWWNNKSGNNLPTYVTETCATYQQAQEDLLGSLLEYTHPLLKRVYWFSAYKEPIVPNWNCNLLSANGDLTGIGEIFKDRQAFINTPVPTPNKLTPISEPPTATKTPVPTSTPTPTNTPTATATKTPTVTPTATIDIGGTTDLPDEVEPIIANPVIMTDSVYLPLISK